MRLRNLFPQKYLTAGSRLLFPNLCLGCQHPIPQGSDLRLCARCYRSTSRMEDPCCLRCGEFYPDAVHDLAICHHCSAMRFHFEHAMSAYRSEGVVMRLIHDFKYHSKVELRYFIASLLLDSLRKFEERVGPLDRSWGLCPVPLHPSRERERQYNQSWELCVALQKWRSIPCQKLLSRVRATRSQATLNREERLRNLKQAFAPARESLWRHPPRPRNVILVDDVFTTGSTVQECSKVLRFELGIEKVVVITVARG